MAYFDKRYHPPGTARRRSTTGAVVSGTGRPALAWLRWGVSYRHRARQPLSWWPLACCSGGCAAGVC